MRMCRPNSLNCLFPKGQREVANALCWNKKLDFQIYLQACRTVASGAKTLPYLALKREIALDITLISKQNSALLNMV